MIAEKRKLFFFFSFRWKKAMEAVHRAKLLLLLADFSGVKSSLPAIVARYKVTCFLS